MIKKGKLVLGIVLSFAGLYFFIESFNSFTGFVVKEDAISFFAKDFLYIFLIIFGIALMSSSRYYPVKSRIGEDTTLERLAKEATNDQYIQRDIDHLSNQLSKGNENAGIGSKRLFGHVSYLRGRNGGRVFYTHSPDGEGYEILGKSSKYNEGQVIDRLSSLYEEKEARIAGRIYNIKTRRKSA